MNRFPSTVLSFLLLVSIPFLPVYSQEVDGGTALTPAARAKVDSIAAKAWAQLLTNLDKELPTMTKPPSEKQIVRDFTDLLDNRSYNLSEHKRDIILYEKKDAVTALAKEFAQKFENRQSLPPSGTSTQDKTQKLAIDHGSAGKEELRPFIFYQLPDSGWAFSKDDGSSLSNTLRLVKQLSRNEFDDVIKTNGNPDFVSFNYFYMWEYPAMSMMWIKNDKIVNLPPQHNLNGDKVAFEKTESLGSWYDNNKQTIEDNNVLPRLAEAFKAGIVQLKQQNEEAINKQNALLNAQLNEQQEANRPILAKLKNIAEQHKESTLVFKSFYLGMPIDDAVKLVACYLGKDANNSGLSSAAYADGKWVMDDASGVRITADKDGKVTAFYFPKKCVATLFEANDLDTASFIETFQKAYSLPDFTRLTGPIEVFSKNAMVGRMDGISPIAMKFALQVKWTTTSDKGASITILGDITVLDKQTLMQFNMADSISIIPDGSLLIRKINKAAFD